MGRITGNPVSTPATRTPTPARTVTPPRRNGRVNVQAAIARAEQQQDSNPSGFFGTLKDAVGDVGRMATALPGGIVRFAGDVAQDPVALGAVGTVLGGPIGLAIGAGLGGALDYGIDGSFDLPATRSIAGSFQRTGGRLAHPGRYVDAVREGNIAPVLLEDVGNIALFGQAASAPIRAAANRAATEAATLAAQRTAAQQAARAGLGAATTDVIRAAFTGSDDALRGMAQVSAAERAMQAASRATPAETMAAARAGRLSELAGQVGVIGHPYRAVGRQIGSALERTPLPGALRTARAALAETPTAQRLGTIGDVMLTSRINREVRNVVNPFEHERALRIRDAYNRVIPAAQNLTPVQSTAAQIVAQGEGVGAFKAIADMADDPALAGTGILDEVARRMARGYEAPGVQVSPEAVRMAAAYYAGDKAVRAALDPTVTALREQSQVRTAAQQAGEGGTTYSSEWAGREPLRSVADADKGVVRARRGIRERTAEIERLQRRAAELGGQQLPTELVRNPRRLAREHYDGAVSAARQVIDEQPAVAAQALGVETIANPDVAARQLADQFITGKVSPALEQTIGTLLPAAVAEVNLGPLGNIERAARRANEGTNRFATEAARTAAPAVEAGAKLQQIRDLRVRLGRNERLLARWTEAEKVRVADALNRIDAAPAKWRPAVQFNRTAVAALEDYAKAVEGIPGAAEKIAAMAADIPTTLADIIDAFDQAGLDPVHLIGGLEKADRYGRSLFTHATDRGGPKVRNAPTNYRREVGVSPRSVRGTLERETDFIRTVVGNKAAEALAQRFGSSVASLVDSGHLGEGRWRTRAAADGTTIIVNELGQAVHSVDINNALLANKLGLAQFRRQTPSHITGDSLVVDQAILDGFYRQYAPGGPFELAAQALFDPARRQWKNAVLALSPAWNVNNALGNFVLATVAGVKPTDMIRMIPEAKGIVADLTAGRVPAGHPEFAQFLGTTQNFDQAAWAAGRPAGREVGPIRRATRKVSDASYRLNENIDMFGRTVVALDQIKKGATPEAAIRHALNYMGDFSNMTWFERDVIRRVLPFYAWARHVTRLTYRLGRDHPLAVAWTLHLADPQMYGGDYQDVPLATGSLFTGGGFLPLTGFNPLAAALPGSNPLLPITAEGEPSISATLRSFGPEFKIGAALAGLNLNRSDLRMTRPPGTGNFDAYGRQTLTPLAFRPRELLQYAGNMFPQYRLGRDLVQGPMARYDVGGPILAGGQPLGQQSRTNALLRFAGIPAPSPVDVEDIRNRREVRLAQAQRSRERYNQARSEVASPLRGVFG